LRRVTTDLLRGKPIIQGNDLEEVWALKDVNFEIRRGETVGTGFHLELTERENVYRNGVILAMKRAEFES
jgi:lipopolysaccharide transport system ATP-binding protein